MRSKSEVRLRSAILSKLILLLLALTLQREKFEGVNAEDWPYTTETPENIYILIMFFPDKGKSVGAWLRMVCRPFSIFNKARTRSFDTNTLTFDISQNP